MKRFWTLTALLCLSLPLVAAPARAQNCTIGGHNETQENFAPGGWSTINMTPGTVTGAPSGSHLLISEVAPRGAGTGAASDSSEYVEIYNPTPAPISLDNVYLSDDPQYWTVVNGPHALGQATDFLLRFPGGLMLNPGRTAVICVTKQGFAGSSATAPGAQYFLEMTNTNANTADDMISLGTNSTFPVTGGLLTNPSSTNGETLNLFCWGGSSDLVCDLDYASWGAASAANVKINKTGVAIDGPDAGSATSSYLPDTPAGSQTNLGSGTALTKPNTYQRTGPETGETPTGGNGCYTTLSPVPGVIEWHQLEGVPTPTIHFHMRWMNTDPARTTDPIHMEMRSQDFGVYLPDLGLIGAKDIPPIQPNSFFDVFFDVDLSSLPPEPPQELPGGGPPSGNNPCGPDTNWTGNVDVMWTGTGSGTGITGSVNKHYGNLLINPGAGPSYLHIKAVACAVPATWSIPAPLCPGFSATLVNEDKSPAPNPLPLGWTGWISVTAAPGTPVPTTCCFPINFVCQGVAATLDLCVTTCGWGTQPTLAVVDWKRLASTVRFHQRWTNPNSSPTGAISGDMSSQPFGVFAQDFGPIGHFDVPPIPPSSFFDVFLEVPIAQLPQEPPIDSPSGNPANPCPTDTSFHCNVDIHWDGPGGSGQVNKHYGDLFICPGARPSYLHTLTFCNAPTGATWSINGLCPGFSATLVNEDKTTPAPNPVPPGWTGWICVSAPASTPLGVNCCFNVTFVCDGVPGKIDICAITCDCQHHGPTLGTVDWTNIPGSKERFHVRMVNPSPAVTTDPATLHLASQPFGVFAPNFGPIGSSDIPPLQPNSFFDVFFDIDLGALPPEPPQQLPGGGPSGGAPCPSDTVWNGNVDVQWNDPAGGGQVNKHYANLLVRPGPAPSYLHVLVFCGNAAGATWNIAGLCPGFSAVLLNQDFTPAPNPVPPGWFGWISMQALAGVPPGAQCCFTLTFVCDGSPGVINLCAQTCEWGTTDVPSFPTASAEFGIHAMLPNPTSGSTDISFAVTRAGEARLEVFDLSGKRVRVLVSSAITAGPHTVHWNGRGESGRSLPPGAYFVTLKANERFASRKIVLFR